MKNLFFNVYFVLIASISPAGVFFFSRFAVFFDAQWLSVLIALIPRFPDLGINFGWKCIFSKSSFLGLIPHFRPYSCFFSNWSLGLMLFGLKSFGLIQLVTWLNFFKLSVSAIGHLA